MSTTYNRAELLDRIEAALAEEARRHAAKAKAERDEHEAKAVEWVERHGDAWAKAATKIRASIRKGKPITDQMLPGKRDSWGGHALALFSDRLRGDAYEPSRSLTLLRSAVRTLENESFTPTQLTTVISPTDFRGAIRVLSHYEGA